MNPRGKKLAKLFADAMGPLGSSDRSDLPRQGATRRKRTELEKLMARRERERELML